MANDLEYSMEDSWFERRDKFGFLHNDDEASIMEELTIADNLACSIAQRRAEWDSYLAVNPYPSLVKNKQLKTMVRKGIPFEHRSKIWQWCLGADRQRCSQPGYYRSLVIRAEVTNSQAIHQIDLDLKRTFPNNPLFDGEETIAMMRRVLTAYSLRSPEIGYCQSMNFLCAILLMHMDEEEAFWSLAAIVEKLLPKGYYSPQLPGAHVECRVLEALIRWKIPDLAELLDELSINVSLIGLEWFLTLFVNVLPIETALRVWDCAFYEGTKVLFRVAIALLMRWSSACIASREFAVVFTILGKAPRSAFDADVLLEKCFEKKWIGSFPMKKIKTLRRMYLPEVLEELDGFDKKRKQLREQRERDAAVLQEQDENEQSDEDDA